MKQRKIDPTKLSQKALELSALQTVELKDRCYMEDPWLWCCEQVITVDEATQQKLKWPQKPYLKELFDAIQTTQLLIIPKSRRMMVSWALSAWATWKVRYFENNLILIQSETEDKAAYLTDQRCAMIEGNLESKLLRREFDAWRTKKGAIGKILYKGTQSIMLAVPQGGDVVRAYTFSVLIMDESEFQQEGDRALTAALPIAEKGAKLILTSSSNGPTGVIASICREVGFTRFT